MRCFLKEERARLKLNQLAVYNDIGVSKATYARWESGSPIPSDKLIKLIELGFDAVYVLTGIRSSPITDQQSKPLNREEEILLDNYRHSSPKAQAAIKATSDALAQREVNKKIR
jgi:transcriptional regulator with XRE-family HTH domain